MIRIYQTIHSIADEAKGPSYSVKRACEEIAKINKIVLVDADYNESVTLPAFSVSCPPSFGPAKLGLSKEMYKFLLNKAQNVYPGQIAKKFNLPLVTSPRGTFAEAAWSSGSKIKKLFWPLIQKPALEPTTCFHATSFAEYKDIRRMGYRQPVAVIPNGMDIPSGFIKQPAEIKTLLFLGRIHPIKGLDILLNAWSIVQDKFPDWQLKIVGPDNYGYLKELQIIATSLRLIKIIFQNAVYGEDKFKEYVNASVYILPSYSENFAMSVAEALAVGTPSIVTKGAPWEELNTYNAGMWVDTDVKSVADAIDVMLSKPDNELLQMGNNAKQLIQQNYSWDIIGNKINQMYDWILGRIVKPDFILED